MALYLFLFINVLLIPTISATTKSPQSPPPTPKCLLFNFGDSNSDTGGSCAASGIIPQASPGHAPSCRASNGLLYVDYLCKKLGTESLTPYMESLGSNFTNGANFAISAMTAQLMTNMCFSLITQVNQFAYFQYRVRQLVGKGKGPHITKYDLRNAIYSIDIGQNDISYSLLLSHHEIVNEKIPKALQSIENATKSLYDFGARKFLIYNTGPLCCLPAIIETGRKSGHYVRLDQAGCLADCNELARTFNDGLALLSAKLRSEMKGAIIVLVDMYTIKYDLIVDPSKYGLQNPLVPCLRYEGSTRTICLDPARAISWDGLHFSDAANRIMASKVWFGDYASPYMKFNDICEIVIKD